MRSELRRIAGEARRCAGSPSGDQLGSSGRGEHGAELVQLLARVFEGRRLVEILERARASCGARLPDLRIPRLGGG